MSRASPHASPLRSAQPDPATFETSNYPHVSFSREQRDPLPRDPGQLSRPRAQIVSDWPTHFEPEYLTLDPEEGYVWVPGHSAWIGHWQWIPEGWFLPPRSDLRWHEPATVMIGERIVHINGHWAPWHFAIAPRF